MEPGDGDRSGLRLETSKMQQRVCGTAPGGRLRLRWRRRRDEAAASAAVVMEVDAPRVVADGFYCAGWIARTVGSAASRSSVSSGIQPTIES